MTHTTVIIGTSAAGMAAAHKLRQLDPLRKIICITKEVDLPYNRCLLADYLAGSQSRDNIITRREDYFLEQSLNLITGMTVSQLDVRAKKIISHDGLELSYDSLVIATGRSSSVPARLGRSLQGVFPFYDLAHADAIKQYAQEYGIKHAIVVGAGLSGLECADALAQLGIAVSVIEQAPQILPHQIDAEGSSFLMQCAASKGIDILTGQTVIDIIAAHERIKGAILASGTELEAELLVFATGGKQNIDWITGSGITTDDHGIVVDGYGRTSLPDIWAAGDICSVPDLLTGKRTSSCLWPDAVAQGITVASNLAGSLREFAGTLSITSSHIFGTTFVTCGSGFNAAAGDCLVKKESNFYHRFYLTDGVITGFIMVGNIGNLGQLRKAILNKERVAK